MSLDSVVKKLRKSVSVTAGKDSSKDKNDVKPKR